MSPFSVVDGFLTSRCSPVKFWCHLLSAFRYDRAEDSRGARDRKKRKMVDSDDEEILPTRCAGLRTHAQGLGCQGLGCIVQS